MKLNNYNYNHEGTGNLETNQEPERQILYQLKLCKYYFCFHSQLVLLVVRESESNRN